MIDVERNPTNAGHATLDPVPIYEYVCLGCENRFDELTTVDSEAPPCPDCGSARTRKRLSLFASPSGGDMPGIGGGGCCGGGACGCGH